MTVTLAVEPWDSADGVRLRRATQVELAARYNMPDQESEPPTAEAISVTSANHRSPRKQSSVRQALDKRCLRNRE